MSDCFEGSCKDQNQAMYKWVTVLKDLVRIKTRRCINEWLFWRILYAVVNRACLAHGRKWYANDIHDRSEWPSSHILDVYACSHVQLANFISFKEMLSSQNGGPETEKQSFMRFAPTGWTQHTDAVTVWGFLSKKSLVREYLLQRPANNKRYAVSSCKESEPVA